MATENHLSSRAFLQRAEVRLSTLQRIAGTFIGGAGLLILIPFFFKDLLSIELTYFFKFKNEYRTQFPIFDINIKQLFSGGYEWDYSFISYLCCVFFPLLVLIYISLLSIILLFKDIVRFYYIPNEFPAINEKDQFHLSRLSLTALKIPLDEVSDDFLEQIVKKHKEFESQGFVTPTNVDDYEFKTIVKLISMTNGHIVGLKEFNPAEYFNKGNLISVSEEQKEKLLSLIYKAYENLSTSNRITILDEVAKMEASLIRHTYFIRRLILRYVKSILTLITLTIFLLCLLAFIKVKLDLFEASKEFIILNNSVWSVSLFELIIFFFVYYFVTRPTNWVRTFSDIEMHVKERSASGNRKMAQQQDLKMWRDPQLLEFEITVQNFCFYSITSILIGVSLAGNRANTLTYLLLWFVMVVSFAIIKTTTEYGQENLFRNGFLFKEILKVFTGAIKKLLPFIKIWEDTVSGAGEKLVEFEENNT